MSEIQWCPYCERAMFLAGYYIPASSEDPHVDKYLCDRCGHKEFVKRKDGTPSDLIATVAEQMRTVDYAPRRLFPAQACQVCGDIPPDGARFCVECGSRLAVTGRTQRLHQ
jgi:rRNA maturation endonuclease Nob1